MSTVSGITSKGDPNKQSSKQTKYSSLNINTLYKGKSLENPKTTVVPKHGLQTLGKVGAGRRVPPPANLPSLKSESAGSVNINLVPSGGTGWGKETKSQEDHLDGRRGEEVDKEEQHQHQQQPTQLANNSTQLIPSSANSYTAGPHLILPPPPCPIGPPRAHPGPVPTSGSSPSAGVIATGPASSKTWSSITSRPEDGGPTKQYLAHQSPFFPQEFPSLDGGGVRTGSDQMTSSKAAGAEVAYGPGPSLRPATEGSWGRGGMSGEDRRAYGQPVSNGSGVNGQPLTSGGPEASSGRLYPGPGFPGIPPQVRGTHPQIVLPPGSLQMSPGYRGMVHPYMYGRNNNYPFPPQLQGLQGRPGYPYPADVRMVPPQMRSIEDEGHFHRPGVPILTDDDIKGFDEILENESHAEWLSATTEMDYNARVDFGDDDEEHESVSQKNAKSDNYAYRDEGARPELHRSVSDEHQRRQRLGNIPDWEKHDGRDKHRYNYRTPARPEGSTASRYDHRTPEHQGPTPQGQPYSQSPNFSHSQRNRDIPDEDEIWRQKSRQHSDEMTAAVARARQRREEEEKKYERSRQAAQEKAKALEEKAKSASSNVVQPMKPEPEKETCHEKKKEESVDITHEIRSSGIQDDQQAKDTRGSNREAFNTNYPAKQYTKNMPPRFQKLQQQHYHHQYQQHQGWPTGTTVSSRYSDSAGSHSPRSMGDLSHLNVIQKNQENWRQSRDSVPELNKPRDQDVPVPHVLARPVPETYIQSEPASIHVKESKHRNEGRTSSRESRGKIKDDERRLDNVSGESRIVSGDEKLKKLDWVVECDDISRTLGTARKDWHRPTPITQKHFDTIPDLGKGSNLITLKKGTAVENKPREEKNKSGQGNKDMFKAKPSESKTDSIENAPSSNLETEGRKELHDSEKEKPLDDEKSKEVKCKHGDYHEQKEKKDSRYRGDRGDRDHKGKSKDYRRCRENRERQPKGERNGKDEKNAPRKLSKSRKKSHNSEESLLSEEGRKMEKDKPDSGPLSGKHERDNRKSDHRIKEEQNHTVLPGGKEEMKRGSNAMRGKTSTRGTARVYGPSNYGPPPSKAAFGEVKLASKSNSMEKNQPSKSDLNKTPIGQWNNNQAFHDKPSGEQKKPGDSRSEGKSSRNQLNKHRSDDIPPRFQRKQQGGGNPSRGGGRGGRNPTGTRTERNRERVIAESDMGNEEWETASESSDVAERHYDKRSEKDSKSLNRRKDKQERKDNDRPSQRSTNSPRPSNPRNQNRGERGGRHSQRNGPFNPSTKEYTVYAVSETKLDNPDAVEEAINDIKSRRQEKVMKSMEEDRDIDEGFQTVSHKKRFKNTTDIKDTKNIKQEHLIKDQDRVVRSSRTNKLPPRFAKAKANQKLNLLCDEAFCDANTMKLEDVKEEEESKQITVEKHRHQQQQQQHQNQPVVTQPVNAWTKPLSHSLQVSSLTTVTTTAGVNKSVNKPVNDPPTVVSSKSSNFDHQDSGIDVSDQPASTASSQRSSPNNDENKAAISSAPSMKASSKHITSTADSLKVVDDIEPNRPMSTFIFENKNLKAENAVLEKLGTKPEKIVKEFPTTTTSTIVAAQSSDSSNLIPQPSKIDDLPKLDFPIKVESSVVNKVVGSSRNTTGHHFSNASNQNSSCPPADEFQQQMKIASVKKVWENPPSMPVVLERNEDANNDSFNKKFDEKLKISSEQTSEHSIAPIGPNIASGQQMARGGDHKMRPNVPVQSHYSQQHQQQLAHQQSLLFSSPSPPTASHVRTGLDSIQRQMQSNYHLSAMPPISSPPNMMYNNQSAAGGTVGGPANPMYNSFTMENLAQVMAQMATPNHYQPLLHPQNTSLNQAPAPVYVRGTGTMSPADQFRVNQGQANLAASHLLKSQFVQSATNQAVQGLHHGMNQGPNYYSAASGTTTGFYQHQHYGYGSTPSASSATMNLMGGANLGQQQTQQYRGLPMAFGRPIEGNSAVRGSNAGGQMGHRGHFGSSSHRVIGNSKKNEN